MDISGNDCRSGSTCAILAAAGTLLGRANSPMWVERMMSPLGFVTRMGSVASRKFANGISSQPKKWLVAPVSATLSTVGTEGGPDVSTTIEVGLGVTFFVARLE